MHYGMERRDDGSVIPLWMMERWDLSPHEKNNDGDSPAELARQKGKEALAEAMEQKWREMSALEESSRIAEGVGAGFALPGMGPRRV